MRPAILDPLFAPARHLPGVGPKLGRLLDRLLLGPGSAPGAEARVLDLLLHLPSGAIDRRTRPVIARVPEGAVVTLAVTVGRHSPAPPRGRAPYRVHAFDETGEIVLVWFNARPDWLERLLPVGAQRLVSGRVEWFNGAPQMVHPDYVVAPEEAASLPAIEPVYPLTEGLSGRVLRRIIAAALERLPQLPEWLARDLAPSGLPAFTEAVRRLHGPQRADDVDSTGPYVQRLAFDELLAGQLAIALVRAHLRRPQGRPRPASGALAEKVRAALPFALTRSQEEAFAAIARDLAGPERMLRLLQGDVGSGKTAVALLAMAQAVEAGGQAALMAPTEILARQHFATIEPVARAAGMTGALLTGRDRPREREEITARIAAGTIDIAVGTHALIQEDVAFRDLALVVVDEQHRFGVHQRLALSGKGRGTDILVMTATPIPRTLVLTYFGDMDVSQLTEKPAGRKPIDTRAIPLSRIDEVIARIDAALAAGAKAYWVCPLVEDSEASDLAAATARAADLEARLGRPVALVHGAMKPAEKEAMMRAFRDGTARILVATTVIEVGVDVPDATIMVIEHAERFGLAQLHQLRGRVGRGDRASTCLLLYRAPLSSTAEARLRVMRETEDGFRIAEEDLRLRGEGDVLGTRQSGTPGFRIADPQCHAQLLERARDAARIILSRNPRLEGPEGEAIRVLLYLFDRHEAVRLVRAG